MSESALPIFARCVLCGIDFSSEDEFRVHVWNEHSDSFRGVELPQLRAAPVPAQQELFLLRALYRTVSAYLAADYLDEHKLKLVEAVKRVHDFKTGHTT